MSLSRQTCARHATDHVSSAFSGHQSTDNLSAAVVVPTYRRPEELERCLHALERQTRPPDEICVVHRDAGDPATEAIVAAWKRRQGCSSRLTAMVSVPGVIAAMDMGVRSTTCDIIAVVDDDVQLQPDWLERCLCHYADPSVIGVGGRDIVHERGAPCEALQARVGHVTWYGRIIGNHHRGSGMARPVDVLKGANMSLRRHYWVLDKRLHGTGAQVHWEVQVCLRVRRQNGTLIYDPGCLVDHFPAQRFDNDQRGAPTRKAIADACHNEVYILLTYLAWWQRIPYLLYTFVIGRRGSWAALRWIMIRSVGESVSFHDQLIPSYRGKLTGLVSWLVVSKWRPLSSIYHVSAIANGDRYADNTPPTIRERIA